MSTSWRQSQPDPRWKQSGTCDTSSTRIITISFFLSSFWSFYFSVSICICALDKRTSFHLFFCNLGLKWDRLTVVSITVVTRDLPLTKGRGLFILTFAKTWRDYWLDQGNVFIHLHIVIWYVLGVLLTKREFKKKRKAGESQYVFWY